MMAGLISRLFGKKEKTIRFVGELPVLPDAEKVRKVRIPNRDPLVVPMGTFESTVYTYDGRPLDDIMVGDCFSLDYVRGKHTMASVYTDTICANASGACAYKGKMIGFLANRLAEDAFDKLIKKHKRIIFQAKCTGIDKGGYPLIVALLPPKSWYKEQLSR